MPAGEQPIETSQLGAATAHADAGDTRTLGAATSYADAGDARTLEQAQRYSDAGHANTLNAAQQHTNAAVGALRKEAFSGIAQAAALVPITPSAPGKNTVNAAVASYGGQAALGITFARRFTESLTVSGGVGVGGKKRLVKLAMGYEF